LESRIRLKVSVRFGGKFSETWHGDMSRRTVLTLQGVQYAAIDYTDLLDDAKIQVSMSNLGQPTENALAERFMRTLKEEHVDYTEYADFDDALRQLANWLEVEYMTERIHSALDYLTPAEFEAALVDSQADPLLMYA
jgi:putative transposase